MIFSDFLGIPEPEYSWERDVLDIEYAKNREELRKAVDRASPNWCMVHGLALGVALQRLEAADE